MKTIQLILSLILVALVGACKKSDMHTIPSNGEYSITASMSDDTKLNIDGISIKWKVGDKIRIFEVEDGNKFNVLAIDYEITDNSSISSDGKTATFTSSYQLHQNKKYVAFYPYMTTSPQNGILNIFSPLSQKQLKRDDYSHIENKILLTSDIININDNQPVNFTFKHQMSILELNISLDETIQESFEITSINVETDQDYPCFTSSFNTNATFNQFGNKYSGNKLSLEFEERPELTKTTPLTAKLLTIWNEEIKTTGEIIATITINTTQTGVRAVVRKPIKIFEIGKLYKTDLVVKPINYPVQDRDALIALYNATGGDNWTNNTNWCSNKPLNEWYGVQCYNDRVQHIDLHMNNLTGQIPKEIGLLDSLSSLKLNMNNLSGKLPSEFSNLFNLSLLQLDGNNFNDFENTISVLSKLPHLGYATIGLNYFFNGSLPESITQVMSLPKLEHLDITFCGFGGKIPNAVLNHPRWNDFAFHIVPQRVRTNEHPAVGGFDLTNVDYYVSDFSVTDLHGKTLTQDIFAQNKLTLISTIPIGLDSGIDKLPLIHSSYSNKGLGLLSFFRSWDGGQEWVDNMVQKYNMTWWTFIESRPNNYIKNLPKGVLVSMSGESWLASIIVDNTGKVVFNGDVSGDSKVMEFLASYFGQQPALYESSDYSKDGEVTTLQQATKGAGVDIVIMGDGFSDRDMAPNGKYETRMKQAMNQFFAVEPTKSYRDYFNVYSVKAISKNEGYDFGSKTIFDCSFGAGTQINGNTAKCSEYAKKVSGIQIEKTLVIVVLNSPRYAGTTHMTTSGEAYAFTPYINNDETQFARVLQHEAIGHGFGKLLDEYIYYNEIIPNDYASELSMQHGFGWGLNLSLSPNQLPWSHFIGVPKYYMVGQYEGGYFFKYGVWRAEQNSCMNDNVPYFNGPSRELIVKQVKRLSSETYNWTDFINNDKYEPIQGTKSFVSKPEERFAPPVIIKR